MRDALSDLPSVADITTDASTQLCTFSVDLDQLDLAEKLNELSKSNEHIAGWTNITTGG